MPSSGVFNRRDRGLKCEGALKKDRPESAGEKKRKEVIRYST